MCVSICMTCACDSPPNRGTRGHILQGNSYTQGPELSQRRHWRGDLCPSWDTFATRLIRGKRSVDKEVPVSEVSAGAARPHHSNVSATFSPPLPHAHSPPTPAPCLRMNIKTNAWTNPSAGHTHSHITLNLLPLLLELSVQMPFVCGLA